jgi:dTDP-glucose 4,6-dehydratase
VDDHNRALDLVMRNGKPGEVYNIGASNERNNLEITGMILEKLGKPQSLIRHVTDRLGHDRRYAIDSSKIQNTLGWKPMISFNEGLDSTIAWYLNNSDWIGRLRQRFERLEAEQSVVHA